MPQPLPMSLQDAATAAGQWQLGDSDRQERWQVQLRPQERRLHPARPGPVRESQGQKGE